MPCRYQFSLPVKCRRSASLNLPSLMVPAFLLGLRRTHCAAPLPVGETGVASSQRLLRNRKSNEIDRFLGAISSVFLGGSRLTRARAAPLGSPPAGGQKAFRLGGHERCVMRSSPEWAET